MPPKFGGGGGHILKGASLTFLCSYSKKLNKICSSVDLFFSMLSYIGLSLCECSLTHNTCFEDIIIVAQRTRRNIKVEAGQANNIESISI